ncbi:MULTISPECIES: ROK family transcriptional regulator [unclassified Azospirillum]|uniref:ROK family transcriptional regulator n=1 Tax=unclassified Azospirillum TaxID=2630922 RepID=UPI000B735369|nr:MULTISPECIES: ROK family transcriptional regulator [unclassified Azospirillum]SNT00034.1 Sugar kinase of the NBD/HSP70 family, may contain an N-terminal HTH domain [Azospirillum sp. RU38E]SNT16106.1 Sugar kinase of the NBD/HSP70 family, may contain an N-terminal HTH domain [Azospirillum sp. RU37A]
MLNPTQRQALRTIAEGGPLSRSDLAERLDLSKAAMTTLVRDLIQDGILRETETVRGVGRPSILLGINPACAYFVGVSLIDDPMMMVLTDLNGDILAQASLPRSREPLSVARDVAAGIGLLLDGKPVQRDQLAGIGVTLSGLVDPSQGTCLQSTLLGWQDVPLAAMVEGATGLPTYMENDAKAVAISQHLYGAARDVRSFCLVSVGAGIGSAHVIDGQLYRGRRGGAGEIAHCTIEIGGRPCRCGKRGCLDTIASVSAILGESASSGLPCQSVAELEALAATGEARAVRILHHAGEALGLAIAHIIQINDPELILITHDEAPLDGLIGRAMRQAIDAHVLPLSAGQTPIHIVRTQPDHWARGAAGLVAHKFFHDPDFFQ